MLMKVQANQVAHIVVGARQASLQRTLPGSVSSQIAAEAKCTVTVVRSDENMRT